MHGRWSASNGTPDEVPLAHSEFTEFKSVPLEILHAALALAGVARPRCSCTRVASRARCVTSKSIGRPRHARSAAEPLYRVEDGHFQFKYLPAFALAATPLAALPLNAAKASWFALSAALLVALLVLSLRLLAERRRPTWLLVTVMLVTMAKFFGHELVLGQVNLLFAVLVVCGILAMGRKRDIGRRHVLRCRGGGQAVRAAVPAVACRRARPERRGQRHAAPYSSRWRRRPSFMGSTGPSRCTAPGGGRHQSTAPEPDEPRQCRLSLPGWRNGWARIATATLVTAALISGALLAVASVVIAQGRNVTGREALEGALLLTLVPLLSPQGWDYVFLVATPAIAIIVNNDDRLPTPLRALTWLALAAIGLSIYDVLGRQLYSRFMALSIITPCFMVVVAALTALRLRRLA